MKSLIINGDDYGLSEGVNRGIVECHSDGALTSLTILPNGPAFDDGIERLDSTPTLAAGIHLNLVRGKPVSKVESVSSLLSSGGELKGLASFTISLLMGAIRLEEVERELRVQIEKVLKRGIEATHLDSHRHFHNLPPVMEIVRRLAVEYGIRCIRVSTPLKGAAAGSGLKGPLLGYFAGRCRKEVLKGRGIITNDYYTDAFTEMNPSDFKGRLDAFLTALPDGVTDLGIHPGYNGGITLKGEETYDREKDMSIIKSTIMDDKLKELSINTINYGELQLEG